jgi:hypothetical protein
MGTNQRTNEHDCDEVEPNKEYSCLYNPDKNTSMRCNQRVLRSIIVDPDFWWGLVNKETDDTRNCK